MYECNFIWICHNKRLIHRYTLHFHKFSYLCILLIGVNSGTCPPLHYLTRTLTFCFINTKQTTAHSNRFPGSAILNSIHKISINVQLSHQVFFLHSLLEDVFIEIHYLLDYTSCESTLVYVQVLSINLLSSQYGLSLGVS